MVITVTCPSCSTSFPVDPAKIPEGGVNARCSACSAVFRVEKPPEMEPLPTLEDLAPTEAETEPAATEEPVAAEEPLGYAAEPAVDSPPAGGAPAADATSTATPPPLPEPSSAEAGLAGGEAPTGTESAADPLPEIDAGVPEEGAWAGGDVSGAGDVGEGAAADGLDDWVVEHEERPSMEPEPLPPVADRLPEIAEPEAGPGFDAAGETSSVVHGWGESTDDGFDTAGDDGEAPPSEYSADSDLPGFDAAPFAEAGGAPEQPADIEQPEAVVDEVSTESGSTDEVESPVEAAASADSGAMEPEPTGSDEGPSESDGEARSHEEAGSAGVKGFTFGKRDPTDKAKRLARVLVSDMIMYNAERHKSALASGTLAQDFEDEIDKSWKEYVDQVGADMANGEGRQYWTAALNDILAKGQEVF